MSRKAGKSLDHDQYPTPAWCVEVLLQAGLPLPLDSELPWLEPCAGAGAIIENMPTSLKWVAGELDPKYNQALLDLDRDVVVRCPQDFLTWDLKQQFACVMTNPPYTLSFEFVEKSLSLSDHVLMLLRLNWVGSIARYEIVKQTKPDMHVLTPRPSFTNGGTDGTEYAWFHFHPESTGKLSLLPLGPIKERGGKKKQPRPFSIDATKQRPA